MEKLKVLMETSSRHVHVTKEDLKILFGEGAATGLTRDVTGSMMQSFEAIKAATNLDIPGLLNKVASGGLVGRRVPDAATNEPAEAPAEPQTESEE